MVDQTDRPSDADIQTTFNLLRKHGATLVLDTYGKNRIRYRERDDCYLRHGPEMETPNDYTTCSDKHVAEDIEKHGIRKVIKG